jgi:glioma pathogenesis-related protein 2
MRVREVVMRSVSHQKRFMGLTVACVATIVALGMLGQGTALGQDADQLEKFRAKALADTNADRETLVSTPDVTLADPTDALNTGSQSWALHMASTGDFNHASAKDRTLPNGDVAGENIFVEYIPTSGSLTPDALAKDMVADWWAEKANYDYSQPGSKPAQTGHFTQLAWVSTTTIGCGYGVGQATINGTVYNAYYGVCRYDPPGNVAGQYAANVMPPK